MILYGAPVSPYVRKVLAVAGEKGLEMQLIPVGIGDPNPDFLAVSPFRKMPALRDGDFSISDSSAIVAYLDAKHPTPKLIPDDAEGRARVTWFDEFSDTILVAAFGKVFFNRIVAPKFMGRDGDEALAKQGEEEAIPLFDYLEKTIPASGYLVGDQLTLADITVASPFVNLAHCDIAPDPVTYPKLTEFLAKIQGRDAMASWIDREKKMLGKA